MNDFLFCAMVLALIILLFNINKTCSEGLIDRPSESDINNYKNDIQVNKDVFYGGSFYKAREKMPWIDPIAFEEIRMLAKKNKLNNDSSINAVFN